LPELDFALLRRHPDIEADNLFAHDAADRLLLDTAAEALAGCAAGQLAVIGDQYGALTLGAAARHGLAGIRVHQDPLSGELALAGNARTAGLAHSYASRPLGADLLAGATVVLLRLPRSLEALEEIAWLVAAHADPAVQVFAGGMAKHMALAMNEVLGRHFASVAAGLARQKARVLTATGPLPAGGGGFPLEASYDVGLPQPLQLRAYGATFGGAKLDPGTRFLLPQLDGARRADSAVDLGCGNGSIAAYLAMARPGV
jgi:16S rRNA (guanine1207-N2)-methyltransferase